MIDRSILFHEPERKLDWTPLPAPKRKGSKIFLKFVSRFVLLSALIGLAALAAPYVWSYLRNTGRSTIEPLTSVATRSTLRITVTEQGNVESCNTVDGICEVDGHQNKIIFLLPEGTRVKKGDVVCKFDSAEIDRKIAEQEIKTKQAKAKIETATQEIEVQKNKGDSEISDSRVEKILAELNLQKYKNGDYLVEIDDLNGAIALAKKEVEEAKDKLEQFRTLVKKGFKSPEQLRSVEQEFARAENFLTRDVQKLKVKQEYEYKLKTTELESKVAQAESKLKRSIATAAAELSKANSELESAKSTFMVEERELKNYLEQKGKCAIAAAIEGILTYANQYYWDSDRQIREGATVYSRQKIFSIPDMTKMEVKVNVHESLVKKVKEGQKAEIRVDALPRLKLTGTVKTVSQVADSTRSWIDGGVKQYPAVVTIDSLPSDELKPGMTAEVKILVSEIPDVLLVPLQALTEHQGEHYVFVRNGEGYEKKQVEIGESNDKFVQILRGLAEGESVALDARTRGEAEFKQDLKPAAPPPSESKPAPPAAPPAP